MRGGRGCRVVLADGQTALFTAVDVLVEIGSMESDAFPRRVLILEEVALVLHTSAVDLFKEPHQILLGEPAGFGQGDSLGGGGLGRCRRRGLGSVPIAGSKKRPAAPERSPAQHGTG